MIKEFNRQNLQQLRADMQSAIIAVAQKHGIQIEVGNASFYPEKATFKILLITKGDGTASNPRENALQADFKRYCNQFGLKPEQFGAVFTFGRETYKLSGLKIRAPKMPILATSTRDGKLYKLPESAIASLQSKDFRSMFGSAPVTPAPMGQCSEENAFDLKTMTPIGQCKKQATTTRKDGFGRNARMRSFCDDCAHLRDEARNEMEAEARANR